ncbi:MAG: hypothetical protein HYY18_06615 [Planctomycetes bacterium]|nr:hypothetical protein [Planctomycetota bacterium]
MPGTTVPEGYRTQAEDTSPEIEQILIEGWRAMPSWRKVQLIRDMNLACEELARAGVRMRHPAASEREIQLRVASLRLDRETMLKVFAWDPVKEGY